MKFTKEEISLCKQVAEKYRKEIKYGDWYISTLVNLVCLWKSATPFNRDFVNICEPQGQADKIIPLWTISDCLKFLNKRDWNAVTLSWRMEQVGDNPEIAYCEIIHDNFYEVEDKKALNHVMDFEAKTLLEACLKAVLAILEEKK